MPTQEDINAANVELQIANDNYAQLADRYNKYQELFQTYAKSSPEIQDRAADAMWRALEDFYQIEEKMRVAEDRIAVAQNTVNSYNEVIASQPVQTSTQWWQRRRQIPSNDQLRLNEYLNAGYTVWNDWLLYTPSGIAVNQNWYNINSKWQFVPATETITVIEPEPIQAPAPETTLETIPEQKPALIWYQSPISDYSRTLINKGGSTQYTPAQPTSNITPLSTWWNWVSTLRQNNQSRIYPTHVNWYTWRLWSATITPRGYVDNNLRWTKNLNTWWSGVWTL